MVKIALHKFSAKEISSYAEYIYKDPTTLQMRVIKGIRIDWIKKAINYSDRSIKKTANYGAS